ncbi:MAG TPA: carboxymuconolactone decarboxylase family protein [Thermoleophilia bacterium]|nr:carboxymuconolactone decarboxylase family protein [Thermoleophilia bacterium]
MPRPEEVEVVKAMKAAKTGEEILASWAMQRPGYKPGAGGDPSLDFWVKRRPDMLHTYAQNQLTGLLDRGILDPKTRYLLLVGLYMMNDHYDGVMPQASNAKAAGATEEEIMEVAFCVCYSVGKAKLQETGACLDAVFSNPMFQSIEALKK